MQETPKIHRLGITGTRYGWTPAQRTAFAVLFRKLLPGIVDHGDCEGVDTQVATLVHHMTPRPRIICHPPLDVTHRAYNQHSDEELPARTHFARNRDIVDVTDGMVVIPREADHQPRGGTWYTFDYARKKKKPAFLIEPEGAVLLFIEKGTVLSVSLEEER